MPRAEVWVEIPTRPPYLLTCATVTHYTWTGEEVEETRDLVLDGETACADEDDDMEDRSADDDDTIPIRTIDNFCLFDSKTGEFIESQSVLVEDYSSDYIGSGVVRPFCEDDDDDGGDADTPGLTIVLSSILECNVHWVADDGQFDPKIYLRTQHAWYILLRPAQSYARLHTSFSQHHALTHTLLCYVTKASESTMADFMALVAQRPHTPQSSVFRFVGNVSPECLSSPNLVSRLHAMCIYLMSEDQRDLHHKVAQSTLIRGLFPSLRSPSTTLQPRRRRRPQDVEKDVLQHSDCTVVTPRVGAIAQMLFSQSLHTVKMSAGPEHSALPEAPLCPIHSTNPESVEWGRNTECPHVFQNVIIDGTTYTAGDVVIVETGDDTDKERSKNALSSQAYCHRNGLANEKWFCKINYFFEKKVSSGPHKGWGKFFHAQWLVHGSKTLLQEASHPRALYWLNECEDLPLECIYSLCNYHSLPPGQVEPPVDDTGGDNNYFTGLTLDDQHHSFIQMSSEELCTALAQCEQHKPCVSCGLRSLSEVRARWTPLPKGGYCYSGIDFHVHDFVYVHQGGSAGLLSIAQITHFSDECNGVQLTVHFYGRYDDAIDQSCCDTEPIQRDNRRLFQTKILSTVDSSSIEGKAYVSCPSSAKGKEAWVERDDHFYCDLKSHCSNLSSVSLEELMPITSALPQCQECHAADLRAFSEDQKLLSLFPKLRGLELFAGAGGLSTGLEKSGFIETKWAVEFSPSAAKTFQANHPNCVVYNESSNCLLEHAVDASEGRNPNPLKCKGKDRQLPHMPQRGDVDFIYGGPPCQSFSMMNHHRRPDDIRSTLVCNMISYVDFYRPQYFLLENVAGLLSYKLLRQTPGKHAVKELSMGVVKFIMRALLSLGYQVQFRVLQAGQYGAPQGRRRVIFIGARGDVPLPSYPVPHHAYPKPLNNFKLPNQEVLYPTFRSGCRDEGHQCAPLPPVTISQAISDLPKFDWLNPYKEIVATTQDRKDYHTRRLEGIKCFHPKGSPEDGPYPGFNAPVQYTHPPLSRYQMWVRSGGEGTVSQHYTPRYGPKVTERVCSVPMPTKKRPNPNHEDLPPRLRIKRLQNCDAKKQQASSTIFGRLNSDGHFITAMTTLMPNAKGGRVIHHDQHRVLTIRECARAQGFPDRYIFQSTNANKPTANSADQMRQIGNAVPVPLALAIGKEVGKATIKLWKQNQEQEQTARARSPAVE
ncbi:S-adenosyl-L-methionine-dependent methyltransferase [Daedaleopsis nitida]|nr:S-adenosyl-L-methionine-dependent methyltransferase [Daedaleopsis nitida]